VPEIDRQQAMGQRVAFRADAAFARPAIYEALEARGVEYAIRIQSTRTWSWRPKTSCFGRRVGRASSRSFATRASTIRRTAGPRPDGSW
jgi:hypothetical protein